MKTRKQLMRGNKMKTKNDFDYGKCAFILVLIIIFLGFMSHIHITMLSPEATMVVSTKIVYNCPGVGEQTDIGGFIGCKEVGLKQVHSIQQGERFLAVYWK